MVELLALSVFFFNDTATTEIYTLSLHERSSDLLTEGRPKVTAIICALGLDEATALRHRSEEHTSELQSPYGISYSVLCLEKILLPRHQTRWRPVRGARGAPYARARP